MIKKLSEKNYKLMNLAQFTSDKIYLKKVEHTFTKVIGHRWYWVFNHNKNKKSGLIPLNFMNTL